jgi:glycerol-3-phosphate dehydrogenase (NAD(P)+)
MPPRPHLSLPSPGSRRAVVLGAGSFGTATAVLLARGGFRTTLQARTPEQCTRLERDRENREYLPEMMLPRDLRVESMAAKLGRADYVFLVPPAGLRRRRSCRTRSAPAESRAWAGPAHAREMVTEGAGLVAASTDERLALMIANVFMRAGVVCEQSSEPVGVELAGVAKNAAALAAGATEAQGLNAAGAAAGHIFLEVWRFAERQEARPESMIGLAGTGDLVATALAPQSRNRRAGELPLDAWVAQVRATVPPPARFDGGAAWRRTWWRLRTRLRGRA